MSADSCGVSIFVWVLNVMWLLQSKWVPIFIGCLFSESVGGYSLPHWISMVDLDREIKAFVLTSLSNVLCWISMWCDRVVPKCWTKILGGKTNLIMGDTIICIVNTYMWRTDCKLDQFVNRPLVYIPVIQFLNWLARFQLYKVKWSHLENRQNGLKAG